MAGRFTLIDHVGSGGSGSVWRAYDHRERCYSAAKVLRPVDTTALVRAVREQAFRLSHPHLLTPYSWVAEDDDVLLAMDLVRGGSLATLVNDYGRLPAPFAAAVLDQLLDALSHVHAAGIVHRDVKPANILMDPTGTSAPRARLTDFGIAVGADGTRLTSTGVVVGTQGYVAPEVLAGRESGPSQDLYAAGRVARRMLLGAGTSDDEGQPPDVPAALRSLVDGLCEPRPGDRPASADEARRELTGCRLVLRLPAQTADGDPIEVFDQTGPLPPGWGPDGPAPTQPIREPAVTVNAGPVAWPAAPPLAGPVAASEPADTEPVQTEPVRTEPIRPVPSRQGPGPVFPPPAVPPGAVPPGAVPPGGRRLAVVAGVATVVVLATTGAVLAYTNGGPDSGPGGEGSRTPSPSASTAPGTVQPSRQPLPGITAGDACGWQDVGTQERLTDGRLVKCEYQPDDGTYRWKLVS